MRALFDKEDILISEQIRNLQDKTNDYTVLPSIAFSSHAEGIIEISSTIELRIAGAMELLLNSVDTNELGVRLKALERLYRDVSAVERGLRVNAARVLVDIMKEILGCKNDIKHRLELIRDFRETYTGKPLIVRKQLQLHQLLEIPEDESQLSFDDTVYNASKVGKKNPALLILDAWIKGIRKLQVIFSNYISSEVAHELLSSAEILGVEVEIGIELPVVYNEKFIKLVWTPLGVTSSSAFLQALNSSAVEKILGRGHAVAGYHQELIFKLLKRFDSEVKSRVEHEFGVKFSTLNAKNYREFLGDCEASEVNLGEFIYNSITQIKRRELDGQVHELIPEIIVLRFLKPLSLSTPINLTTAQAEGSVASDLKDLIKLFNNTTGGYRLTLLTSNLYSWEIPEILYRSKGGIGAVEIFNLRDYTLASEGIIKYGDGRVNEFRKAINERDITNIKRILSEDIHEVSSRDIEKQSEVIEGLQKVRKNIGKLLDRYSATHIEAAIGSGSAGRGMVFYGMGLVVMQSLHSFAINKLLSSTPSEHLALPLGCQVYKRVEYLSGGIGVKNYWHRFIAWRKRKTIWIRQKTEDVTSGGLEGNIYTLSGRFGEERTRSRVRGLGYKWKYLNTDIKSLIKILIGFVPAFLTFYFTADWPVLKYGGGVIWFAITGGRNAFQAVLAAGGFDRSLNYKWRTFVDKKRVAESLMYTGLSVPLLEYFVKDLFLNNFLGVDAGRDPVMVYAVISAVNGVYISLHNFVRGFAMAAVIGNLFRSVLAIPIAVGISSVLSESLGILGVLGIASIVTQWSAVISKAASDVVACVIEGFADREIYISLRRRHINELVIKFLYLCERIDLILPHKTVLEELDNPEELVAICLKKHSTVSDELVLLLLDLMHFWYSKCRAKSAIRKVLKDLHIEEKELLMAAIKILEREELVEGTIKRIKTLQNHKGLEEFYKKKHTKFVRLLSKLLVT